MTDLLKKILEILEKNGPLKAKKTALLLDSTRTTITHTDVNSELYKALTQNLDGLTKDKNNIWSYINPDIVKISFENSPNWVRAKVFEQILSNYPNLLNSKREVIFDFSNKSLLLDCILKILSLTNQLIRSGSRVTLKFDKDSDGFRYLSRCGFFDNIHKKVTIFPYRPEVSLAKIYNSNSDNLCEILAINRDDDGSYLLRLTELIKAKLSEKDKQLLLNKLRTFIGELVDNIREHGLSSIDGYIALQIYSSGKIIIAISDSGSGLLHTLRTEALLYHQDNSDLISFTEQSLESDIGLLAYVFNKGKISRTGSERRGLGLSRTNEILKKISTTDVSDISLIIRQQSYELDFPFGENGIEPNGCRTKSELTFIEGTHYVLTIQLDK